MKRFIVGLLASIGAFTLFTFIAILIMAKITQGQQQTIQPRTVLFLQFSDTFSENGNSSDLYQFIGRHKNSLYHMVQAIDQASKDPRIVGIVARLDQAHMGIAQTQELRNAIMRFRVSGRDQNKFTIAHADTFGELSPGTIPYYLASAFEEIWLQPMGNICMTGLYAEIPYAKDALDNLGVKARMGKREEFKSAMDTFTENRMPKASRESTQDLLNSLMNQIVRDVALSRELNELDVWENINKGPLFGPDPLKLNMVDRIDYFDEIKPYIRDKLKDDFAIIKPENYLASNPLPQVKPGTNKIALIFGTGVISRKHDLPNNPFGEGAMHPEVIKIAFEKAAQDEDVAAIVFRINSPGGSPVASESILRAVRKAKLSGKPIIVSMSDMAGSAGYWIASHADRIVAHPSTVTGSIGVLGGKWVTKDAWEKWGIHWDHVKIGENATMWSNVEDYTPFGWERLQASLDDVYNSFIERVSEGRKLPKEHVMQVAKGRVLSGEDALKFGLVDKLGDLREAIEIAKEMSSLKDQQVPIEIFPQPVSFGEKIGQLLLGDDENDIEMEDTGFTSSLQSIQVLLEYIYIGIRGLIYTPNEITMTPIKNIKG